MPKVYKIIKLRQLFLSKCPQNNFKILYFDGFLRFFDIFLKFKKKRGKKSGQNHKKYKIETILMSILKSLKWFSEKYSREKKSSFYYSFSISYFFFALWTPKRHKKWNETWESSLLQKEVFMQKVLNLLQKFNKCCKKNFQQFFGTWFISKIFFWMFYQHVPKKNLRKLEQLMRNSQKTAFSWANTAGML